MSYEKTIANDHRIYQITLPASPTPIIDTLSLSDRQEYDTIVNSGLLGDPNNSNVIKVVYKRMVVDCYIVKYDGIMAISTSASGATEPVLAGVQYLIPVSNALEKTFVSGSGTALVRVFFS